MPLLRVVPSLSLAPPQIFYYQSCITRYRMKGEDQLLQKSKIKDQQFIKNVLTNICLYSVYSGYCLGYFNTINFDETLEIFDIRADRGLMQGLMSFCIPIGAALGGYCAKFLYDHFTRRQALQKMGYCCITVTLLLQIKSLPLIFLCRFIQGVTVGASTVLRGTYIKQFAPIQMAGRFGAINQVFFAVGLIFAFALSYILSLIWTSAFYWRIVYLMPAVIISIHVYYLKWHYPYQTPKFLIEQGRKKQAKQLLSLIYTIQYIEERFAQLEKAIIMGGSRQIIQLQKVEGGGGVKNQLHSNKIAIMAAYHLGIFQQVSGIQVIILYAGDILLKLYPFLEKLVPLFLQIIGLLASLQSVRLISVRGRKDIIQNGGLVMAISLLIVAFCFLITDGEKLGGIIIVIGLVIARATFSMTLGPVVWLYIPQIVEPNINGIATMLNWLTAAIVSLVYPIGVEMTGTPAFMFILFALALLLGMHINKKILVETKGKTEWEIRHQYDQKLSNHF